MQGPDLQPLSVPSAVARAWESPIERWMRPFVRFLQVESASGTVLLLCTLVALILANSPWAGGFEEVWRTPFTIAIGSFELSKPLLLWVNDGLMTIFFFVVGLEIKRELVAGELRDPKKAALPIMAALGGMVAPAAIYLLLQRGTPAEPGWGIPMATDIAFVVGFLALLGPRVPLGLKILLLSLAIADDIGAVLVIALFYSKSISLGSLGLAFLGFALVFFLNGIGVRRVSVYAIVGAAIWFAFLKSGVHPTVAGVMLGLLTPGRPWVGRPGTLDALQTSAREAVSPLERLETGLHPWVAFGIMPIFALANAGVGIDLRAVGDPVSLSVGVGLVVGKPLGILAFSWLAVTAGWARLPAGVNWKVMLGAGCLAGIGFTMSLFIAGLALDGELLSAGKIGTLTGSALSALLGSILLLAFLPGGPPAAERLRAMP